MKQLTFYYRILWLVSAMLILFLLSWMLAGNNTAIHAIGAVGTVVTIITESLLLIRISQTEPCYIASPSHLINRVNLVNVEDPKNVILAYTGEFTMFEVIKKSDFTLIETTKGFTAFRKPGSNYNHWSREIDKKLRAEKSEV